MNNKGTTMFAVYFEDHWLLDIPKAKALIYEAQGFDIVCMECYLTVYRNDF